MRTLITALVAIIAATALGCWIGSTAWYAAPRVGARVWRRLRARTRGAR